LHTIVVGKVAFDFLCSETGLETTGTLQIVLGVASRLDTYGGTGDVGQVSGHTGRVDNIVEREFGDELARLEEKRKRLLERVSVIGRVELEGDEIPGQYHQRLRQRL
jgi:hypothetical protein